MCVVNKTPARGSIGSALCPIGVMPVHERVIKPNSQTFGARCLYVFAYQIPPWTLLGCVVVRELRIPQAEALVMLGCHYHVLLSGSLGQSREVARRIWLGLELLRERHVFLNRDCLVLHRPFMTSP